MEKIFPFSLLQIIQQYQRLKKLWKNFFHLVQVAAGQG
jgi:hypothetical protein